MKCIACGREMLDRETHYECSNVLCDCEEEIENQKRPMNAIVTQRHCLTPSWLIA